MLLIYIIIIISVNKYIVSTGILYGKEMTSVPLCIFTGCDDSYLYYCPPTRQQILLHKLLFAFEKFSWETRCQEYFTPRTSPLMYMYRICLRLSWSQKTIAAKQFIASISRKTTSDFLCQFEYYNISTRVKDDENSLILIKVIGYPTFWTHLLEYDFAVFTWDFLLFYFNNK